MVLLAEATGYWWRSERRWHRAARPDRGSTMPGSQHSVGSTG
jgi:hypothetical protein